MEKLTLLFEEFMLKAIERTELILNLDFSNSDNKLESFTENRERLLAIIGQIAQQIDWNQVSDEKRNGLNRQIEYIKRLDEKLLTKLQEHRETLKTDIERTVRQKENIKGYNLADVK